MKDPYPPSRSYSDFDITFQNVTHCFLTTSKKNPSYDSQWMQVNDYRSCMHNKLAEAAPYLKRPPPADGMTIMEKYATRNKDGDGVRAYETDYGL